MFDLAWLAPVVSAPELDVGEAYLVFEVETTGASHARSIIRSIRDHGYEVRHVNA